MQPLEVELQEQNQGDLCLEDALQALRAQTSQAGDLGPVAGRLASLSAQIR